MHINMSFLHKFYATLSKSILKKMERFSNKKRFWILILHCISSWKIEAVM
jgi:hypothetical protein